MPTYSYRCEDGHEHDKYRVVRARNRRSKCPGCGKKSSRVLSAFGIGGLEAIGKGYANLEMPLGRKFSSAKEVDAFLESTNTRQNVSGNKEKGCQKYSSLQPEELAPYL